VSRLSFAGSDPIPVPRFWHSLLDRTSYPETAGRTLEEIDLIFAKGYAEHRSYVNVSLELPKLNDTEVRDELDRLHREHESRKGRLPAEEVGAGMPGSDQNTLANAEAEIEADALATNEKKPAAGGEKRNLWRCCGAVSFHPPLSGPTLPFPPHRISFPP
jgi:hypothetical protein